MAALGPENEIDFATLRDLIETEDSALSKAIAHLQRAGYVLARKGYVANKPRTWVKATSAGHAALSKHIDALQAIAAGMPINPLSG